MARNTIYMDLLIYLFVYKPGMFCVAINIDCMFNLYTIQNFQAHWNKCCILASYCVKDNAFMYVLFRLHNSFWYMFRPDGAIFRCVMLLYNHLPFTTLPHKKNIYHALPMCEHGQCGGD
jgi:hypothetical protein